MRFLTWANDPSDPRCELMFASAKHFGIEVEPIGVGREYRGGVSKIEWLYQWLKGKRFDTLIVCTDAYDCIWLKNPRHMIDWINGRGCQVAYAAERWYRKRQSQLQGLYDYLVEYVYFEPHSLYRYPNCGCVIGFSSALKKLLESALGSAEVHANSTEQWHMTEAISLSDCRDVVLDRHAELFYCCGGEWRRFAGEVVDGRFSNKRTGTYPYILHAPIPRRSLAIRERVARELGII